MGLRAIYSCRGLKLACDLHLEPRLKISEVIPPPSAHGVDRGNLTFTVAFTFYVLQNSKKSQVWVNSGEDPAKGQEYDNKEGNWICHKLK